MAECNQVMFSSLPTHSVAYMRVQTGQEENNKIHLGCNQAQKKQQDKAILISTVYTNRGTHDWNGEEVGNRCGALALQYNYNGLITLC